jgi:acyl carrier protein
MSISEEEVFRRLRTIIVDALRVDPAVVAPQADLFKDLGAESIDIVDVRFRIEDAFGFKLGQQELGEAAAGEAVAADAPRSLTVQQIAKYVLWRVQEREVV